MATPMGDDFPIDKIDPHQVVTAALDGLQAGRTEILADEISHVIKSTLTSDPSRYAAILGG